MPCSGPRTRTGGALGVECGRLVERVGADREDGAQLGAGVVDRGDAVEQRAGELDRRRTPGREVVGECRGGRGHEVRGGRVRVGRVGSVGVVTASGSQTSAAATTRHRRRAAPPSANPPRAPPSRGMIAPPVAT